MALLLAAEFDSLPKQCVMVLRSTMRRLASSWRGWLRRLAERDHVLRMLSLALPPRPRKPRQASRGRFLDVFSESTGLIEGVAQANARAAARLPELAAEAVGLIEALASEAPYQEGEESAYYLWLFHATPDGRDQELNPGHLAADDVRDLLGLLTAASDWIAFSACRMLWNGRYKGLEREIEHVLSNSSPPRRFLLAILCWRLSEEPTNRLRAFFESDDPVLRRAAASASRGDGDVEVVAVREVALLDDDATVRLAAGATVLEGPGVPAPRCWSCRQCAEVNEFDVDACRGCDQGTRPQPNES